MLQDGHTQAIQEAWLSRDGRILASGGFDGVVRIWDTATGLLLRRVATGSTTFGLSLSDTGDTLATYAPDGQSLSIQVHDLAAGTAPRAFTPTGHVFRLSPDGRFLAIGLNGLWLHDVKSGKKLGDVDLGKGSLAQAVAFDPEGKRVAVAMAGANASELAVVEVPSLRVVRRWKNPVYAEMKDVPRQVALSGETLVVRTAVGAVHVLDVKEGGAAPRQLAGAFADAAVAGSLLWTVDMASGTPSAWQLATLSPQGPRPPLERPAQHIGVSADGSTFVAVSNDPREGQFMRIVDAASRRTLRTIAGLPAVLTAVGVSPDGARIATGSRIGIVTRWNGRDGKLEGLSQGELSDVVGLSYDAKGAQLVAARHSPTVRTLEPATGRVSRQWSASSFVSFAQFLPASTDLVTVAWDGSVTRWDLSGPIPPGQLRPPVATQAVAAPPGKPIGKLGWLVRQGQLSPDGTFIALSGEKGMALPTGGFAPTGGGDAIVAALNVADGTLRWEAAVPKAQPHVRFAGVSADGKSVLFSTAELLPGPYGSPIYIPTLRVYDAKTGALGETLKPNTMGPVAALGDTVVVGGIRPVVYAWAKRVERQRLAVLDTNTTAIAVHRERGIFALAGDGGGTTVLSEKTGKVAAVFVATPDGEFVTTTPDGAFLSSLDGARRVGWSFQQPLEAFAFDQFAARLLRPDLVAKRLAGDDAPAPPIARPPQVRLGKVARSVAAKSLPLKVTVSSARRVERLRAYVNGRPVADKPVCASSADVALDVPLSAGSNRVTVVAYDPEGFSSNPQTVDVASTAQGAARPELWVAAIGVSKYPKLAPEHQLDFADDDARAIAAAFATQAGAGRPFASLHATTLIDSEVTPQSTEQAIAALSRMGPDDLAVVFLAGHGVRLDDGKMVYLTSSASLSKEGARDGGVGWDKLQSALKQARGRVLLLLDACHSGHLATELVVPNEALASQLAGDNRSGVLIFAAARGAQLSYEVSGSTAGATRGLELAWDGHPPSLSRPPAGGHGLFSTAVLEALAGEAVDRDKSGAVEVGEFVDYVTERVREASNGRQTPWVVRREMFGDFVVAPARK